jgi:CHAD domain-containing protein
MSYKIGMSLDGAEPRDLAVSGALAAVGRDIVAEARLAIDDPGLSETRAIHDFRKAMKRWRALLRLVGPFVGSDAKALRTQAAEAARGLAVARDRQAALDALTDLAKRDETLSPRSYATMRTRLATDHGPAEVLTDEIRTGLLQVLTDGEDALRRWPLERIGFKGISRELAGAYRLARSEQPDDWAAADPEALHELRKRVVAHRYQMELTEPLWPKLGKLWVGETQKLRDRLGSCQDLTVLAGLTVPRAPLAPWRSRLTPLIAERQAAHRNAARAIAGRVFAEKPRAFRARIEALWKHRVEEDES